MLKKLLKSVIQQRNQDNFAKLQHQLLLQEAKLGGTLFGDVPAGHRREFFCLDEHTWVWHEEWVDENGQTQIVTTRYDVRPSGILKSQNGNHYQQISPQEKLHLTQAARMYAKRIRTDVYAFAL